MTPKRIQLSRKKDWRKPECARNLDGVIGIGALVTDRLRKAGVMDPPVRFATFTRPQCGECGPGRWVEDDDGVPVRRCECAW